MFPTILDLGTHDLPLLGRTHLYLPTYGLLFATGTVLAWWWFTLRARRLRVPDETLFNLTFYTLVAGILGAKLTLVLLDWRDYLRHPADLLGTIRSAGVLIGGVICGAIVFSLYARRHGLPLFRLGDAIAAPLALAQGIGRLGCFSAGCCWGKPLPAESAFSVTFTDPLAREQTGVALDIPLIPTQLYQMIHDLALALLLTWLWRRKIRPAGTVFWIYVLVYSIGRGVIEIWRGDAQRGLFFDGLLSTSQLFAVAGIVFATVMLVRGKLLARRSST